MAELNISDKFAATTNTCKQCSPLGASLVFKGIKDCLPLIHGSQGCSTYIRRYLISHFREPVDIASSSFHEEAAVFGGESNLGIALDNVIRAYHPEVVGICTTCLSETIGDDINLLLHEYESARKEQQLPALVPVSTPSYTGSHAEGFHAAVYSMVKYFATKATKKKIDQINLFPGMVSAEDLRELKRIAASIGKKIHLVPDYSETLDGGTWDEYHHIPPGGTCKSDLKTLTHSEKSIQFGHAAKEHHSDSAEFLEDEFNVPGSTIPIPIGIHNTDLFMKEMGCCPSECELPRDLSGDRARLIDSYLDGHKYLFGKRAAVYGDEDLVVSLASFLSETGVQPVLCASGGASGKLAEKLKRHVLEGFQPEEILEDADFETLHEYARKMDLDFLIGNSKAYYISKDLDVPLIRCGFPVHDRIGAQRILHVGYKGTQNLYDTVVNTVLETKQLSNDIGYKYL